MEEESVKEVTIEWAKNIGSNITMEEWDQLWKSNINNMKAVVLQENVYKMYYRWYLSPNKLAKMYTGAKKKCWKCQECIETFYHLWWSSAKAKKNYGKW